MNSSALVRGRVARDAMPVTLTIASGRRHTAETILAAWFESKSDHTIRGYQHDLENFSDYLARALGLPRIPRLTVPEALDRLFAQSAPSAHEIVLGFRGYLDAAHLAAASINRHLATLRSVSKLARMLGLTVWYLEVPGVKAEKRRQTAGPTLADVRRLLEATSGDSEAETRDYAMVMTFVCCGLRVSELCGLNLEDCDLANNTTWIKGKGRRERELIPLPEAVVASIRRYLAAAGRSLAPAGQRRYDTGRREAWGPLFQSRGQRGKHSDGRLETRSVLRIVRELGRKIGLHLSPHPLRHTAISTAIEYGQKAGLGLDQIRHFSRHKALATMLIYRDEHDRAAVQKTLADVVADTLTDAKKGTGT